MYGSSLRILESVNLHSQIADWHEEGFNIQKAFTEYNWEYRNKVCTKCTEEEKVKYQCFKVNNFVNGIQETHCRKLVRARTKKLGKKIEEFILLHPLYDRSKSLN